MSRRLRAAHNVGRVLIGFAAPVSGSWATPDTIAHVARRAEELGYHELWTFQRLLYPAAGGWDPVYHSVLDPLVVLGHLAATTERIRLGVAVVNLPFVSPTLLAKQLTTVDVLSGGGRVDAGLGIGWSAEEYAATGADKSTRGKQADEYVPVLRALFSGEVVDHDGAFYRVPSAVQLPAPATAGGPPILLGGGADAALRRAGRLADGWVSASRADLTAMGTAISTIKAAADEAGRDPDALRFVCRGAVRVRPEGERDRMLSGTLEQIRDDMAKLERQGVTELFVDLNFDERIGNPDADPAESLAKADAALDAFKP